MFLSTNCDYLFKNVNNFILFNGERLFCVRCEMKFHIFTDFKKANRKKQRIVPSFMANFRTDINR